MPARVTRAATIGLALIGLVLLAILAAASGGVRAAAADPGGNRRWAAQDSAARATLRALPRLAPDTTVLDSAFEAARRARRELGASDPDALASLDTLARDLYFGDGRRAVPRRMLERSLAARSQALPMPDLVGVRALHLLGHVVFDEGEYLEARRLYERARDGYARVLGPDALQVASMTYNLSNTYYLLGENHQALRLLEIARDSFERRGAEARGLLADVHLNMSAVYGGLGDPWSSARAAARCIELRRAIGAPPDHIAAPMVNLAATYFSAQRNAEALALLDSALVLVEPVLAPEHPDRVVLSTKRLEALLGLGRFEEAGRLADEVLRTQRLALGDDHPAIAETYALRADLAGRRGEWARALAYADTAEAMNRRLMPGVEPRASGDQKLLATIRLALGDSLLAFEHALAAERGYREYFEVTAPGASHATLWWREHPRMEALGLAFAALPRGAGGGERMRLADAAMRSRGVILDRECRRLHASAGDPDAVPLREALERAATRLAGLVLRGDAGQTPARYAALLDSARAERERAELALAVRNADFAGERRLAATGFADVLERLPGNAALVAFHEFRDPQPGAGATIVRYAAFVGRRGQSPALLRIGDAAVVTGLVGHWRKEAEGDARAPGAEREAACRRAGEALRRAVWDPLREALGDASTVYLVPDGALQLVNFAALPAPAGSYLLESGPTIVPLSTERDLVREPPAAGAAGNGLLAVGGVDFDRAREGAARGPGGGLAGTSREQGRTYRSARSGCPNLRDLKLGALPGSDWETREVVSRWRDAHAHATVELLSGAGATEARFKRLAPHSALLHLATHAFHAGRECVATPSATEPGPGSPPDAESPLLRSGLALAGFNRRALAAPDAEDGVLTAEEIAALDLSRVRCAVLSACESGIGEAVAGEGVFGLRRAFQVAGVPTLVTSLWRVDDLATRAWMVAFYDRLLAGETPSAAAVAASRSLLARARATGNDTHPSTWGAFVVVGAGR